MIVSNTNTIYAAAVAKDVQKMRWAEQKAAEQKPQEWQM